MENIRYHVRSGERILFWRDRWIGDKNLVAQFLALFNCAMDKDAKVNSYMSRVGDMVVWSPIFRRNLKDQEESQFISLLNLLNGAFIMERGEDSSVDRL